MQLKQTSVLQRPDDCCLTAADTSTGFPASKNNLCSFWRRAKCCVLMHALGCFSGGTKALLRCASGRAGSGW